MLIPYNLLYPFVVGPFIGLSLMFLIFPDARAGTGSIHGTVDTGDGFKHPDSSEKNPLGILEKAVYTVTLGNSRNRRSICVYCILHKYSNMK